MILRKVIQQLRGHQRQLWECFRLGLDKLRKLGVGELSIRVAVSLLEQLRKVCEEPRMLDGGAVTDGVNIAGSNHLEMLVGEQSSLVRLVLDTNSSAELLNHRTRLDSCK